MVEAFWAYVPEWGGEVLAIAPFCEMVKKDDLVLLEDEGVRKAASDSVLLEEDGKEIELIKHATRANKIFRATGKYYLHEFDWSKKEGEDDE